MRGDKEGEYTFTDGGGNAVIDYIMRSGETKERIREMRVGYRVDSDNQPLEIVKKEVEKWRKKSKKVKEGGEVYGMGRGVKNSKES